MTIIETASAQNSLAELLERVSVGEDIVLAFDGVPRARLVPIAPQGSISHRKLGGLAGRGIVPDDFDGPLPDEIIALFEGR